MFLGKTTFTPLKEIFRNEHFPVRQEFDSRLDYRENSAKIEHGRKSERKKSSERIIAIVLRSIVDFPMFDTYRKLGLFMRLPERFVGTFSIP